jgi:hypothetical protein
MLLARPLHRGLARFSLSESLPTRGAGTQEGQSGWEFAIFENRTAHG